MSKAGTNFWCWWRVELQLPDANQREANAVFQPRDDELQSVVETTADAIAAASLQDHPTRKTTTKLNVFSIVDLSKEWSRGMGRRQRASTGASPSPPSNSSSLNGETKFTQLTLQI
jgi:hypothetical protein